MMKHNKRLSGAIVAGALAMVVTGCGGGNKTTPTIGNRTPILSRIESRKLSLNPRLRLLP